MSRHDPILATIAVRPDVVADIVDALPPRLRKRLDAAVDKLVARPTTREGDTVRIAVDDEAALTLNAPGGVVRTSEDVVCACLLAPSCVHRAAAVSALSVADDDTAPDTAGTADADTSDAADTPASPTETAPQTPTSTSTTSTTPILTPPQRAAARTLWAAAAAVLEAGVNGAGAVLQAELLRAAHTAKLAGLHRGSAAAVAVTTGLRTARAEDPAYRLPDLTEALRELLDTAHLLAGTEEPPTPDLIGTARQPYAHKGGLRLYGLFSEPIRTASGHAGVVTYTVGSDGVLRTVSDVMPGSADRIAGAAGRAVRMGDTALDHHALSRAGLLVSGATESPTGRLGAGASVRAVSASGAAWDAEPHAALWAEPPRAQIARVLRTAAMPADTRRAGAELLFLDVEIVGLAATPPTAAGLARGDRVVARCPGLAAYLHLLVADDHPALAYRDNVRLLASRPGLPLRLIGRLEPGTDPAVRVLAVAPAASPADTDSPVLTPAPALQGRVNLGLDRLQQADVQATRPAVAPAPAQPDPRDTPDPHTTPAPDPQHAPPAGHSGARPSAPPAPPPLPAAVPASDEAPAYLVHRQVERAVSGGRPALALAGTLARDTARLRHDGLATGADLLEHLAAAAGDRGRDVFGRLLPGDADLLARRWLATAAYARAVDAALTAHAWGPPGEG